jgi:hypothetical protein
MGAAEAALTRQCDARIQRICPTLPAAEAERLRRRADDILLKALRGRFPMDPMLPRALSRTHSVLASVIKRHGHLIAAAFVAAVNHATAPALVATEIARLRTTAGNRQVDTLIFDRRRSRFTVLEIKRGGGKQPAGSRRDQEVRLAGISQAIPRTARRWLQTLGINAPKRLRWECVILAYYGEYGATTIPVICRPDVATRFGPEVVGVIDLVTQYLQCRLLLACRPLYAQGFAEARDILGSWSVDG